MRLKDLAFTDLLLYGNGQSSIKQSSNSPRLLPVPKECTAELGELELHITKALLDKSQAVTVRAEWDSVRYRVAQAMDVEQGKVWFLRRLASRVPSLSSLNVGNRYGSGMYAIISQWLMATAQSHGLILISGPQASGKTTLASAYVRERLAAHGGHGVTFENPAELPLAGPCGENGYCFQVEINSEDELGQQIERAHRYASPNIIFIGEIRTKWAAREALRVALGSTKQIVVATIHGLDVRSALERIVRWAKEFDGENALDNLSTTLLAAIQLSLEEDNGKPTVQVPQFLLLSHSPDKRQEICGIRSKLRSGQFHMLDDDFNRQQQRIATRGVDSL